ncbi:MAG: type I methionyl aminopeptidase [Candidatus Brocadiia bacterium]
MIRYKSVREIELMREAGRILAGTIEEIKKAVGPEIKTIVFDRIAEDYIKSHNAQPAFKGYRGFPANICVSVNEEIVHGIPDERRIKEGDIVSIDIGVEYKNYYADAAVTLEVGRVSPAARKLVEVTRQSLEKAVAVVRPGAKLSEISSAVQRCAETNGFSVVRDLVGHGVGQELHEDPQIPNYIEPDEGRKDIILKKGMTLAIEPMLTEKSYEIETLSNGWTVVTKDRKLSAHFEHTVAVVEGGCRILTVL